MGLAQSASVWELPRVLGVLDQHSPTVSGTGDERDETHPEHSYDEYRRMFGILWQAFRAAGLDKELEPEVVHKILQQAGKRPYKTFTEVTGDASMMPSAASYRRTVRHQPEQNVLHMSLPIPDGCSIQKIEVQVSSCDQVCMFAY